MNENWVFFSGGMYFKQVLKKAIENGSLGLTAGGDVVMLDANGGLIARAPLSQTALKLSDMVGDTIKIGGERYSVGFAPPMKSSAGFAGGMEYAARPDVQAGKQRREQLKAILANMGVR